MKELPKLGDERTDTPEPETKEVCYRLIIHWKEHGHIRRMGILANALNGYSALCKVGPLISNLVKHNITSVEILEVGEPLV